MYVEQCEQTALKLWDLHTLWGVMGALVNLICIAVASFAVLAQPAVAQGVNTTLPLNYSGQVLQRDGSQTCHSEALECGYT